MTGLVVWIIAKATLSIRKGPLRVESCAIIDKAVLDWLAANLIQKCLRWGAGICLFHDGRIKRFGRLQRTH